MLKKCAAICLCLPAWSAMAVEVTLSPPDDDRWHYPFNGTPGSRATGSCFGAVGTDGFNNRDGIVVLAWDTSGEIPPGQGPEAYDLESLTVTLTVQANENVTASWLVDLTVDEWFTYDLNGDGLINADGIARGEPGDVDGESDDVDAGRPIELFGAGFGPTYTAAGWMENSAYVGSSGDTDIARDPFPFVFQGSTLAMLHVENSVDGLFNETHGVSEFTAVPWATGQPQGYTPGAQSTPFDVTFEIDLDLSGGEIRRYFQEQLDAGRVAVVVTSLMEAEQQSSSGAFPSFYMKEGVALDAGAKAGSLEIGLADPVPAASQWGLIALSLLILVAATLLLRNEPDRAALPRAATERA